MVVKGDDRLMEDADDDVNDATVDDDPWAIRLLPKTTCDVDVGAKPVTCKTAA